jgi:hypothetical protein
MTISFVTSICVSLHSWLKFSEAVHNVWKRAAELRTLRLKVHIAGTATYQYITQMGVFVTTIRNNSEYTETCNKG